jgi:hypothetical protein
MTSGTGLQPTALPAGLARLLRERPAPAPGEYCEMCGEYLDDRHSHVADLTGRSILCCCRACGLLFTSAAAARGRYRTVPDRWLSDPGWSLTDAEWERFQIPVRLAFFFRNSVQDRIVAMYPGPGGATESDLPLDAWDELLADTPLGSALQLDVEALLVDRGEQPAAPTCHLVPIDACYELVGRLRLCWTGFDGGPQARADIAGFLATVHDRSRPIPARAG